MADFKTRFKELRESSGYTQEGIANKLGTSRSRIGMYETGKREPDHETLEMIADFFNVDIDFLLGRSDKTTRLPNAVVLSPQEKSLIEKYRICFNHGRELIEYMAQAEYARCTSNLVLAAHHDSDSFTDEQKKKIAEFTDLAMKDNK